MAFTFYVADCETTGLSPAHGVLEISILRLSDSEQKTWFLKPFESDAIDMGALKVNGYKLEDITCKTKEGRDKFKDPTTTIIEIENWLAEDNSLSEDRCLVGQNISFDKMMLESLWNKCGNADSFPFGRRMVDTMQIELVLDLASNSSRASYSLGALLKKYGIKNDKAHTAAADVKATKELFDKQLEYIRKLMH